MKGSIRGRSTARRAIPIGDEETAGELAERLAATSAQLVREVLARAVVGELEAVPQEHDQSSHAPPLGARTARSISRSLPATW